MRSKNIAVILVLAVAALTWTGCGKGDNQPVPTPEPQKLPPKEPAKPSVSAQVQPVSATSALGTNEVKPAPLAVVSTLADPAAAATPVDSPAPVAIVATPTPAPGPTPTTLSLASLSQDQALMGLQEALSKGLQLAIARLGHEGGFLTNLQVRIPLPEKLQKFETVLRAIKEEKLADEFDATLNHAAEQAVPEAGVVFADALKHMTILDAKAILAGPSDAATQYFRRTTETNLYAAFYPIVQKATRQTGVTAAYQKFMEKANVANLSNKLGNLGTLLGNSLLDKDSGDLDGYVTTKAMDGLFKMVAEEEKRIRENPVARTTALLQNVFGALKR
jgi:hypothetical protein